MKRCGSGAAPAGDPSRRCSSLRQSPSRAAERDTREARAKKIRADCGVRPECLDYALASREPHGIWGGYNEAEHRGMLDAREAG